MPIITLISDFGYFSDYVASIKGAILSIDENIKIIDISHNISPFNKLETAYIIKNSYKNFPKNTVHIICVDSDYHTTNKALISHYNNQYFICSDNGILSLILEENFLETTLVIDSEDKIYNFTAKDLFLKAAFNIFKGQKIETIAKKQTGLNIINIPKPYLNNQKIFGEVIYIDNYGNCISNISKDFFDKNKISDRFDIKLKRQYRRISNSQIDYYNQMRDKFTIYEGKIFSLFNVNNLLEIGIYKGKSNELLGIKVQDEIEMVFL